MRHRISGRRIERNQTHTKKKQMEKRKALAKRRKCNIPGEEEKCNRRLGGLYYYHILMRDSHNKNSNNHNSGSSNSTANNKVYLKFEDDKELSIQ